MYFLVNLQSKSVNAKISPFAYLDPKFLAAYELFSLYKTKFYNY